MDAAKVAGVSAEADAIIASMNLTPAQKKTLEAAMKRSGGSRRMSFAEIEKKYPHVIKDSGRFDPKANKQMVRITCTVKGCSKTREVYTSDLFQVRVCEDHKKAQKDAAKADKKKLLEDFKAKQAASKAAPNPTPDAGEAETPEESEVEETEEAEAEVEAQES